MTEFSKISVLNPIVGRNQSFIITSAGLQVLRGQLIQIPESETEESIAVSLLNTPVIDNLVFQSGSYLDLEGNEIEYDSLRIDAVLIEVNQVKNVIETPIQGRDTTVKEWISDGDYQINIRGIINNDTKLNQKIYPLNIVQDLIALCKAQRSLVVTSTFLNEVFEINDIVIKSYNVPQVEGMRNQQPFSINAVSDVPIDLEELEL